MLIYDGVINVTDREERLVSEGPLPRTFVAYDNPRRHFIVGTASAITFDDLAVFIKSYFPKHDGTQVEAAMCVDGGASSQMSYLNKGAVKTPRDTDVAVPDCVMIVPGKR